MRLLIVDDEKNIRESLKMIFGLEGYDVVCAENGLSAQRILKSKEFDGCICDLKMPGMDGLELLEWMKTEAGLDLPVLMISAFGQVEDAVGSLKKGAEDYIIKPFDPDILVEKVKLWESSRASAEIFEKGRSGSGDDYFLGSGEAAEKLYKKMSRIAAARSNVLITGESGVGKEVSARLIHEWSADPRAPFIAVNIGGIPENLLESELFGYEKGAFTGAEKQKAGLLETAGAGTIFLDEIGEMPLTLQVKMLRVLQDRSFRRLGGLKDIRIRARFITATNRKLEDMVAAGVFRDDLYYRLNVARLEIPPLRERMDDLPRLTGFLIRKLNNLMDRKVTTLSKKAWDKLQAYPFPGNIRELENLLERAMIFSEGDIIEDEELELDGSSTAPLRPAVKNKHSGKTLRDIERESIIAALHRWEGNRSRAAEELGISRRTIINKINDYGLDKE